MKLSEIRKMSQNFPASYSQLDQHQVQEYLRSMGIDPGNLYQELEMESPYVDTHTDISYSNAHFQFHSHTFYEILCCQNSCGAEYLIGTDRYKLQKATSFSSPRMSATGPCCRSICQSPTSGMCCGSRRSL